LHDERGAGVSTAPARWLEKILANGQNRFADSGRFTSAAMQYLLLVYTDAELMDKLPPEDFGEEFTPELRDQEERLRARIASKQ
jgi:hypothetical protein